MNTGADRFYGVQTVCHINLQTPPHSRCILLLHHTLTCHSMVRKLFMSAVHYYLMRCIYQDVTKQMGYMAFTSSKGNHPGGLSSTEANRMIGYISNYGCTTEWTAKWLGSLGLMGMTRGQVCWTVIGYTLDVKVIQWGLSYLYSAKKQTGILQSFLRIPQC